jgi:hypothetical protein
MIVAASFMLALMWMRLQYAMLVGLPRWCAAFDRLTSSCPTLTPLRALQTATVPRHATTLPPNAWSRCSESWSHARGMSGAHCISHLTRTLAK